MGGAEGAQGGEGKQKAYLHGAGRMHPVSLNIKWPAQRPVLEIQGSHIQPPSALVSPSALAMPFVFFKVSCTLS